MTALVKIIVAVVITFLVGSSCSDNSDGTNVLLTQNPVHTTLIESIGVKSNENSKNANPYKRLEYKPGYPLLIREDLAGAQEGRQYRRTSLVSFVHLSDVHVTDTQSPERVPYVRRDGSNFKTAFRNQEALTLQVADAMVQQVNRLTGGPATGRPLSFVIHTGDNGDGRQINELKSYINVFDGSLVNVDTTGEGYIGMQGGFNLPEDPTVYDQYYHPDPPPAGVEPDKFKREYGFPEYPGLLQVATSDFVATGLQVPWYSAHGNHDATIFGSFTTFGFALYGYWDPLATGNIPGFGSQMLYDLPTTMTLNEFLACLSSPTALCSDEIFTFAPKMPIPANAERRLYTVTDFLDIHFDSPPTPGPIGHGFTSDNMANQTLYYQFDITPTIVGITLDTANPSGKPGGSIGSIQAAWLEARLQANSSQYIAGGEVVTTGNQDKLMVLFSHHNLTTMDNDTSLFLAPDPVKLLSDQILDIILSYPNVVLWLNGHSHVNRVWSHRSPANDQILQTGLWEVNTASHIDYPQQGGTIEIVDNNDGTLSIFAVLIDHAAPPNTDPDRLDIMGMAAISRELSVNDPDFDVSFQIGTPTDRNVELLINKPF